MIVGVERFSWNWCETLRLVREHSGLCSRLRRRGKDSDRTIRFAKRGWSVMCWLRRRGPSRRGSGNGRLTTGMLRRFWTWCEPMCWRGPACRRNSVSKSSSDRGRLGLGSELLRERQHHLKRHLPLQLRVFRQEHGSHPAMPQCFEHSISRQPPQLHPAARRARGSTSRAAADLAHCSRSRFSTRPTVTTRSVRGNARPEEPPHRLCDQTEVAVSVSNCLRSYSSWPLRIGPDTVIVISQCRNV